MLEDSHHRTPVEEIHRNERAQQVSSPEMAVHNSTIQQDKTANSTVDATSLQEKITTKEHQEM